MMQIGLIGLGKKGLNLALSLQQKGYQVIAYDIDAEKLQEAARHGLQTVPSLPELAEATQSKRVIWITLSEPELIDYTLELLKHYLSVSDIVIEGSNSHYKDSIRRAMELGGLQIDFLDCGMSPGTGTPQGICAMVGGNRFAFNYCESLFRDIALPNRYLYCGASGSGHFVSMIQSNIVDRMADAIVEGFQEMHNSDLRLDLAKIAGAWGQGSMLSGPVMTLTENALRNSPVPESIKASIRAVTEDN
jgi:6-phosphogluconate dehydrogenase